MQKERVVKSRSIQDIEKLINKLTQGNKLSVSTFTEKKEFNAKSYTIGDLGNFVATMANELIKRGIL